jgi:fructose-1,6-bisphosphatase/sedoheptulose 1,7-bisphosphatase-like protein
MTSGGVKEGVYAACIGRCVDGDVRRICVEEYVYSNEYIALIQHKITAHTFPLVSEVK